jgi:hypothetical protein
MTIAKRAGSSVAHHNPEVGCDDMTQEAMTWLVSHPEMVDKNVDPDGELYHHRLYLLTMRHIIPLARAARAALYGAPCDDQKYTARTIKAVLPSLWSDEHAARPEAEVRSHADPAVGGNWPALVADVRAAFALVGTTDQRILLCRYGLALTWDASGTRAGVSEGAARVRADRAIVAMTDWLNGVYVDTFEPVGTRRTESNARAQFRTHQDYEGE